MLRLEAQIGGLEAAVTLDQESGTGEPHQRERDFGDAECAPDEPAARVPGRPCALAQRVSRITTGAGKRREQTEDDAGQRGDRKAECEHLPAEAQAVEFAHVGRTHRRNGFEPPDTEPKAGDSADGGEQQILREELLYESSASCPE